MRFDLYRDTMYVRSLDFGSKERADKYAQLRYGTQGRAEVAIQSKHSPDFVIIEEHASVVKLEPTFNRYNCLPALCPPPPLPMRGTPNPLPGRTVPPVRRLPRTVLATVLGAVSAVAAVIAIATATGVW